MKLIARQGEIYAHLFENAKTGLARDLYWNIIVEMEPVRLLGEDWDCAFLCDWLVWLIRTIGDFDGMGLAQVRHPELIEASLYLVSQHHWVTVSQLDFRRVDRAGYNLDATFAIDIDMDDQKLRGSFCIQCGLNFAGIVVVPENLFPKPSNSTEVAAAVAQFISLAGLEELRFEGFRYVMRANSD